MNQTLEGTIRLLRYTGGEPVWGVRLQIRCGCGASYGQTFVLGVDRPFTHCLHCGRRTRLRLTWDVARPIREGQSIRMMLAAPRS